MTPLQVEERHRQLGRVLIERLRRCFDKYAKDTSNAYAPSEVAALAFAEAEAAVTEAVERRERERLHGLLERCYNAVDPDRRPELHEALCDELNACHPAPQPREGGQEER